MVRTIGWVAVSVMAVVLAACGGDDDAGLPGTSWRVDALLGSDGSLTSHLPGTTLSADFTADQVNGLSGCNSYFGSYSVEGDAFSAGPLAGTRRACDPVEIMDQESSFLALLEGADRWEQDGDQLELFQGGETVLQFTAATPLELEGSSWSLIAYNNQAEGFVSVIIDTEVTMTFGADTASGMAGCNTYDAGYEADASTLEFGLVAATQKLCPDPEGLMAQEALFLSDLDMVVTYQETADGNLEMFDADGIRLLQFVPAD